MEIETNLPPSRKELRKANKKRKLLALAQVATMNDKDRMADGGGGGAKQTTPEPTGGKRSKRDDSQDSDGGGNVAAADATAESATGAARPAEQAPPEPTQDMVQILSDSQYRDLSQQLSERRQQLSQAPIMQLRAFGERASLLVPPEKRIPLFLTDIQHLLMSTLIGAESPCHPNRWCYLDNAQQISHSVVLVLEGLSLYHYMANESRFEHTNRIFETRLELVLPPSKKPGTIVEQLAQVPLTRAQAHHLIEQYGSLQSAVEMTKDPTLLVRAIFPIEDKEEEAAAAPPEESGGAGAAAGEPLPPGDNFPRTKLLLSALQMVEEGYPMPLRGELSERYKGYVFSKPKYAPVTNFSPMFGVDCEMCRTTSGINELTRVSIVNEKLETVYETLVMPDNRIVNYLTPFSGITPELMKAVTKRLCDVQREVSALLPPDAILIGQSLNSDLTALQMMHPYVIDTSVCFNMSGRRRRKSKLQALAMTFLKESIQANQFGHDSVEDSVASLKLVQMKLANSIEFGDVILCQQRRIDETLRLMKGGAINNNLLAHASAQSKRTAIVHAGTGGEAHQQIRDLIERAQSAYATLGDGDSQTDEQQPVTLYEFESSGKAVKKARELAGQHSLTITNLQLTDRQLDVPDEADRLAGKLDKWIEQLWQGVSHNGMFVVLMGGNEECPSGCAKIAIKQDAAEARRQFAPLRLPEGQGDAEQEESK